MKLKMLTGLGGPDFTLVRNDEREFEEAEAQRLVEAGYAVAIEDPGAEAKKAAEAAEANKAAEAAEAKKAAEAAEAKKATDAAEAKKAADAKKAGGSK